MNISNSNFKKGIVKIRIDDPDDLWYLSHLIDPGDFVTAKTTRKIKIGDSENATVTKKTITLKIEAETIELGDGLVRINGKISQGPEDIPRGSYHSISVEEGSDLTLEKATWLSFQKQRLKEATERKFSYLLCLFDREEALFALTKKSGYEILTTLKGQVAKKSRDVQITKDFYQEIIKALEVYLGRLNPERIIVASPAFYKDDLLKKITNSELKGKIVLAICSDISETSLDEVMKRPELATTLKFSRAREEKMLVDELLGEIKKEGLATYGWTDVRKAVDAGAVSKFLLSDQFIKKKREVGKYLEVDEKMKHVDHLQAEIHIISSESEAGKKLDGLGGVAALLRYKLDW
jgi:protein pelota